MEKSNLEAFRKFVEKAPDNSFARYSLAMEYRKADRMEDALATFKELLARDPTYVPAYLMAGQVAVALDRTEDAQAILKKGIEAAKQANNQHAASEMTILLESIG